MPSLQWIGKDKVVNHHHDVPFKPLVHQYQFTTDGHDEKKGSTNKIIHGDNLEVLKALLPEFESRINCIYIDPPYNTGNDTWVYNDNCDDPRIASWLGKTVGKIGEDLTRDDKWLCMMWPRLKMLHRLLSKNGAIFISIDDGEGHYLRQCVEEIFGKANFVANIIWQRRTSPDARVDLGAAHDYILVFAKDIRKCKFKRLLDEEEKVSSYRNLDNDERGPWASTDYTAQGFRPNQMYRITTPSGAEYSPPPGRCWANVEPVFKKMLMDNRVWFGVDGNSRPRIKAFQSEADGRRAWTWWSNKEVGHNQEAKKEILSIMGSENIFDTPKPVRLISRIIHLATSPGDVILDSFAGSGTTAHATLLKNAEDDGGRRFILVEMMDYAETITAERVRRVMTGYGLGNKAVGGLRGSFDFYTIGEGSLFDEDGGLDPRFPIVSMRQYIAWTEGIPAEAVQPIVNIVHPSWLGTCGDRAVLFNYDPVQATTLDFAFLANLSFPSDNKPAQILIYADYCTIDAAFLGKTRIVFKKIPRDVSRL